MFNTLGNATQFGNQFFPIKKKNPFSTLGDLSQFSTTGADSASWGALDNYSLPDGAILQNVSPVNSSGFDFGNLMSGDFLQGAGSILGGVGALGQAYAGIKGLGLAEDQMAQQNAQWGKNFNAQLASSLGQARNIAEWQRASGANPTYAKTVSELENLRVA